jgi:CTP:molybdopterin cytidylyltransferase MocA
LIRDAHKIAALVLAAGYSSRMGTFKPLLPLGKTTVIEKAVSCFLAAGIQDIRVVVGHRAGEVILVLDCLGVKSVINDHYAKGMYSSVMAGVRSFEPEVQAFFLLPGDSPLVKQQTITELIQFYRESEAGIIYPCIKGLRGHPPLISARYIKSILAWNQPGGLRALLSNYAMDALNVEVADQGVHMDIDYPVDYQKVLENCTD